MQEEANRAEASQEHRDKMPSKVEYFIRAKNRPVNSY
jgi:hypothetical protein